VFCATGSPLIGRGFSPCTDGLGWREVMFTHLPPMENSQEPASGQQYLPSVKGHPGYGPAVSP